jgi:hypothetical protein
MFVAKAGGAVGCDGAIDAGTIDGIEVKLGTLAAVDQGG